MAFASLAPEPPDPLLSVIGQFNADPRPEKIDLGVGVYRDEAGRTPVLRAVKAAEARLLQTQDTKAYLGQIGDAGFLEHLAALTLGPAAGDYQGMQATGGTGALRIGAALLARAAAPTVHVGVPAWANHLPILLAAGVPAREYDHFDPFTQRVAFDRVADALGRAKAGEAVLLQAACHNPTGAGFDAGQWATIAELVASRGLIPFIDVAYQGLGDGLEEDAAGARQVLEAADEALVAVSCAKSFGLYRERTGALFVKAARPEHRAAAHSHMLAIARTMYSMPPDHGAAVVRLVLEDDALRAQWLDELAGMRQRINGLRARLASVGQVGGIDFSGLGSQRGMFSLLPLTPGQIAHLRDRYAVHMVGSGRINLAGLKAQDVEPLLAALRETAAEA